MFWLRLPVGRFLLPILTLVFLCSLRFCLPGLCFSFFFLRQNRVSCISLSPLQRINKCDWSVKNLWGSQKWVLLVGGMSASTAALMRCDNPSKLWEKKKLGFLFCKNSLASNALIGYVDLTYFAKTWPKCSLIMNTTKCVRPFCFFKYFSFYALYCDEDREIFCWPSSK